MDFNEKYKKEELEKYIFEDKLSYREIGRIYEVSDTYIKKVAGKLGISLRKRKTFPKGFVPHNTGKSKKIKCLYCHNETVPSYNRQKYCSNKCNKDFLYEEYITKWLNGEISGLQNNGYSLSRQIRKYLFNTNDCKCELCGWGEINQNTNLVPLQIHHIDGDCENNKKINLQLLCPNCHSLTHNYGSRNKNATEGRTEYFGKN